MKSLILTAAVVAATILIAGATAFAAGNAAPEYGSFEYREALETGTLPTEPTIVSTAPRKLGPGDVGLTDVSYYMGHPYTEGFRGPSSMVPSVIDVGGTFYRVGVDTP